MDIFGNFSNLRGDIEKRKVHRQDEQDFSFSDMAEGVSRIENKNNLKSTFLLKAVVIFLFAILVSRLFSMEIVEGGLNQKLALGNRIHPRILETLRGVIMDDTGKPIVRDTPALALAVYPSDLPKKKVDRADLYAKLAKYTGMSASDIQSLAEKNGLSSLDETILKDNIPHDDALLIEQEIVGLPGVFVAEKSSRVYDSGAGLAHLIGYTGLVSQNELDQNPGQYYLSDRVGKTGLEAEYEKYLRGTHGVEQVEVDSKGQVEKVLVDQSSKPPIAGDNLTLNLDLGLQQKTATALQSGIDAAAKATGQTIDGGTAIVMNVKTGGILSMVSLPSYDNNLFANGISNADYQKLMSDKTLPMLNKATQGVYPPGSISKIILASAGLTEGEITKDTSITTPAAIKIGDYSFPDWKDHSYESTNVERAIAESNDIFFYALGGGFDKIKGIGIDKIKKYWQLFGLGSPTGIDLPGEVSGLLPDNAWKQRVKGEPWYIGDTYHVSIGQGDMLVTPLQMLCATAAIANGGKVLEPQLVNKIVDPLGNVVKEFAPVIKSQDFLSTEVLKTVQEGMRMTVTSGSARSIFPAYPIEVAGKTGTAQFLNNAKTHAWFEAYAPYNDPQIAVIVLVEGGGEGYDISGPVAKDIMSYYFKLTP